MTITDQPDTGPLTKVTVNLVPSAVAGLDAIAQTLGDTHTDTVNRALQLYAVLAKAATGTELAGFTFDVFGDQRRTASVLVVPAGGSQ